MGGTVHRIPGGEVRILPRVEGEDFSDVYVLDVLGLTVLIRERQCDAIVHIDADGAAELQKRPVVTEVFNGGENEHGAPDDYCDECGTQLTRDGECLDGDGYDGLCGNCADKAERKGTWS